MNMSRLFRKTQHQDKKTEKPDPVRLAKLALPYLKTVELSTKTSPELRALILDIESL